MSSSALEFPTSTSTSNTSLLARATSSACVPIDPVLPKIAMWVFSPLISYITFCDSTSLQNNLSVIHNLDALVRVRSFLGKADSFRICPESTCWPPLLKFFLPDQFYPVWPDLPQLYPVGHKMDIHIVLPGKYVPLIGRKPGLAPHVYFMPVLPVEHQVIEAFIIAAFKNEVICLSNCSAIHKAGILCFCGVVHYFFQSHGAAVKQKNGIHIFLYRDKCRILCQMIFFPRWAPGH